MPAMETEPGTGSPSAIAISWLAAAATYPLALIGAVFGQALGALAGGCQWIGVSLPVDRQIWALVNQPVLNFAALPSASGYWLGSTLLPLLVAVSIIGFLPRARSFVLELTIVQIAWAMAVVAVAWMPLLESEDGHLVRFFSLHGKPTALVWLAPAAAACAALLPTLRLLELSRRRHPVGRRAHRLLVVLFHCVAPTVGWLALVLLVRGSVPMVATLAAAFPVTAALIFAWFRFPPPYVHRLSPPGWREIVVLVIAATLFGATVWFAGGPLGDGRSAGVLWGQTQSFNNVRPWIVPRLLTGTD